MNLTLHYPKGLTPSQQRNLIALAVGGLATINDHWPQITALVGARYHGLPIPPVMTFGLQIAALCITSLSRALNRAKSGTGQGIVGAPEIPTVPALVTATPLNLTPVVDDFFNLALSRLPAAAVQEVKATVVQKVADLEKETATNMTQSGLILSFASMGEKEQSLPPAPVKEAVVPILAPPPLAGNVPMAIIPALPAEKIEPTPEEAAAALTTAGA